MAGVRGRVRRRCLLTLGLRLQLMQLLWGPRVLWVLQQLLLQLLQVQQLLGAPQLLLQLLWARWSPGVVAQRTGMLWLAGSLQMQ